MFYVDRGESFNPGNTVSARILMSETHDFLGCWALSLEIKSMALFIDMVMKHSPKIVSKKNPGLQLHSCSFLGLFSPTSPDELKSGPEENTGGEGRLSKADLHFHVTDGMCTHERTHAARTYVCTHAVCTHAHKQIKCNKINRHHLH